MNNFPAIVLTGVGLVSPAGTAKNDFLISLKGRPDETTDSPQPAPPGQLLTRLKITEPKLKIARYLDPVSKNAIVAMKGTLADAGIDQTQISAAPHQYGIVLGTTRGPCLTREGLYASLAARQGKMVSGTLFSHCGYNIAGAMTAIAYGIKGPNLTVADRGDLGLSLLRRARQILLSKRAHTVFAGFTECDGIARRGSVPFGEFAYLLCLETKDRAAERGARILAEVSVQEAECAMPGAERGVVYGARARDNSLLENAETLSVSLPGLPATGDRYLSLFLIGLLSHEPELKKRFPAVAFRAGAGSTGAKVRLLYAEAEMYDLCPP